MSGDDLSWGEVEAVSTEGLVHLEHERNGTRTCGLRTDNNDGESYKVSLNSSPHPVLAGLSGRDFLYANDIDHSSPLGLGEEILAWAELDPSLQCECDVRTPVIIVKDVAPFCEEIPEDPTSPCDEDCDHPEDPECTDDDGHPRRGHGYGHCKNADRPGHQSH